VYAELPASGTLEVVDFGCGKSYLTFALRHLFAELHGRNVRIVALDRDATVIAGCAGIADTLGYADIEFRQGDISDYRAKDAVHLTVSLHACDTATDDALAQAVAWKSRVILAVPCCQHELNSRMDSEALELLERHGILRERFAALATDALRASALEQAGYRTQVIEFVDLEHTAKNLLIRAVRRKEGESRSDADEAVRWSQLMQLLGVGELRVQRIPGAGSGELTGG
jgi:SAM-dependent methyltransferase